MGKLGRMGRWPVAAVAAVAAVSLAACGLQPGPTPVDVPANQVWIEWENHTDEAYAITVLAQGADSPAYGEVEPCTAHGMGLNLDGPFRIGIRDWDDDPSMPGREVADERAWRNADGRLLLVIDEGGRVTLDTWTEQRAPVAGFCP